MPFPFCGKKNKDDAKDPPYSKKNKRGSAIEIVVDEGKALLEEKERTKLVRDESMKLRNDYSNLQKQLNSHIEEVSSLQKIEEELRNRIKDLEKTNIKLKEKAEESEKGKIELEEIKVELQSKLQRPAETITKDVSNVLETDLENVKKEKSKIEDEVKSVQNKLKDAEERHKAAIKSLEKEVDRLKKDQVDNEEKLKKYKHEKDVAENSLSHTKKELEIAKKESHIPRSPIGSSSDEWVTKFKTAEAELKKEREQKSNYERDLSKLTNENAQLKTDKDDVFQKLQSFQTQIEDLKKNLENEERSHKLEVERMQKDLNNKIAEKEATNDQLLTRLSAATAAQVLDGNPNVSDLSDPNRPQKLGEQMSSLYDDQWTDATELLEKLDKFNGDETAIVSTLFELLKSVYNHCKEASENQLSRIEEHIFLPPLEHPAPSSPETNGTDLSPVKSPTSKSMSKIPRYASLSSRGVKIPRFSSHKSRPALPNLTPGKKTIDTDQGKEKDKKKRSNTGSKVKGEKLPEVPVEVRKGIKDYRKMVAKSVIPVIEREVLQKLRSNTEFGDDVVDACQSYISKCVEICWMMCIQDPPVCLKWDVPSDNTFNPDIYRAYTKSGSHIDYIVWPVIYLHDGGSILMKGVAQGK